MKIAMGTVGDCDGSGEIYTGEWIGSKPVKACCPGCPNCSK